MLSIRDEEVRTLAQDLMKSTGAPTITAAIKRALVNELARTNEKVSLRESLEELQRKALGMANHAPDRNYVDSRDDLWDR